MVRNAFAEAGSEVTVYSDHVVDASGSQFGLANLAATCHNEESGKRAWPTTIRRHVISITASIGKQDEFDQLSDAEVLRSTYCRVMPKADLLPNMTYGKDVAPDIVQVFNLDCPETVRYFMDDRVVQFGSAALMDAGMRNLRAVQADAHETLEHSGGKIEILLGDSVFTASLILVLDEVVARYGHHIDAEIGAFVAIPYRNQLDYHIPHGATVVQSLQLLAGFAASGYRDSAGPVSPSAFWWRPGRIEQVSRVTDDGISIEVGPDLAEILNRLTSA
jgi:hypothetical protein